MKKLLAITLLAIHFFNLGGYYLFFGYCINQSDKQLAQRVNNRQFHENDLITVKMALHLPYITGGVDEQAEGEMNINGTYYTYVKRKVTSDTLYLMCLPNTCKTKLHSARSIYAQQVNDMPAGKNNGATIKKGTIVKEYNQPVTHFNFEIAAACSKQEPHTFPLCLINPFKDEMDHPPRI